MSHEPDNLPEPSAEQWEEWQRTCQHEPSYAPQMLNSFYSGGLFTNTCRKCQANIRRPNSDAPWELDPTNDEGMNHL